MEKTISQWINFHKNELLEDIGKQVAINSVSEGYTKENGYGKECTKALETMLSVGKSYGFDTQNYDNRCATLTLKSKDKASKTIGVWNHLDIVPATGEWRYSPFEVTEENGFIFGRGVQDNKGPAIAVLYAMRCIKELGIPLSYDLTQIVGCDEETGMSDAEFYVANCPVPDFSLVADCAFPVCYGEKGIIEVVITSDKLENLSLAINGGTVSNLVPDSATASFVDPSGVNQTVFATGISAHTAFPQGGENAISKLCQDLLLNYGFSEKDKKSIEFLKEATGCFNGEILGIATKDEEFGELTCAGSVVKTNENRVSLTFNIRYCPSVTAEWILANIEKAVKAYNFTITHCHDSKASYFDKNSKEVTTLVEIYNKVTNSNSVPFVMGGGTYARKIPNAVAFGPGIPSDMSVLNLATGHGNCHTPNEAQSIENLLLAVKIYALAFIELNDFFK